MFFDWDGTNLGAEAQQVLETAADYAKQQNFTNVDLAGHADRSGDAGYNMGLSRQRAEAVKAALVKLGLDANGISVAARGESATLVNTADGVREPRNRRVEIRF